MYKQIMSCIITFFLDYGIQIEHGHKEIAVQILVEVLEVSDEIF